MDPVGSLVGSVLIGMGSIFLFAAYKDRRVFGADGIIPQAIARGSITDLENSPLSPNAFGTGAVAGAGEGKQGATVGKLEHALSQIKFVDPNLGADIENQIGNVSAGSTRTELMPLIQLLLLAEAQGLGSSVSVIRAHIREVTGERV